jgi:hypothetical protein
MNSQNFYQSLLSDTTNNENNHSKSSPIYRNDSIYRDRDRNVSIMESQDFKEPSYATFSFLEETSHYQNNNDIIYKNKKSSKIKDLISLIRRNKKDEEQKEAEWKKKQHYSHIGLSRFLKPTYKKYSYMDYPFYNTNSKVDNTEYHL